jgi:hypothetical protein
MGMRWSDRSKRVDLKPLMSVCIIVSDHAVCKTSEAGTMIRSTTLLLHMQKGRRHGGDVCVSSR